MAASDIEQRTDEAVTTVLCQDATLRGLLGRSGPTDDVIVDYDDLGNAKLPAVGKMIVSATQIGGAGDNWRILMDLTAVAVGNGARAKVRSILERIERGSITVALLEAQGLDGVVLQVGPRIPVTMQQGTRDLWAETTTLTLWVTK